jgi:hypothetical protein
VIGRVTSVDVYGWHRHKARTGEELHVMVDGVDVTLRCFRAIMHADGIHGDAFLFKLNEAGKKYIENGQVAKEIRTGAMIIEPGSPL